MQSSGGPMMPITQAQLGQFTESANGLIMSVKWTPKISSFDSKPAADAGSLAWRDSASGGLPEKEISIARIARMASRDPMFLSEAINHSLITVREGLRIGMYLSALYTKASNLEILIDQNKRSPLAGAQQGEFRAKYQTSAAIAMFAAAYYTVWELSRYRSEEVGGITMDFAGIPEFSFLSPAHAMKSTVFYYGMHLERPGAVATELDFVKLTLLYFQAVINEITMRADSFSYVDSFTNQSYKLEGTEFSIKGFEAELAVIEESIEFNRVTFDQIVGNRDAKHKAIRLVERLLCYDFETKKNPFADLGGFTTVRMGHGEPGTGKSLQIAGTATLLSDYCKEFGIPFQFRPMPDTVISTFQGGSAERMMAWMKPLRDTDKLIYAPIDDAENNLEERTRQGVSAGVREVIGIFLRNTEGAYAVNHGNTAIEVYTNLPDQIDKAVLSRIGDRFYIGGAKSFEDFLDQDHLWWKKFLKIDPEFVAMIDPAYVYLESQKHVKSLSVVYEGRKESSEGKIREIFDRVFKKYKSNEHAYFAELYVQVKASYPFFTSRDVRNIQNAVNERVMDFDLPEEWLGQPDLFFKKNYEIKLGMLKECVRANMKGLSFAEIRMQEAITYLDSMVKIADAGRNRRLQETIEQMVIQWEASNKAKALMID